MNKKQRAYIVLVAICGILIPFLIGTPKFREAYLFALLLAALVVLLATAFAKILVLLGDD